MKEVRKTLNVQVLSHLVNENAWVHLTGGRFKDYKNLEKHLPSNHCIYILYLTCSQMLKMVPVMVTGQRLFNISKSFFLILLFYCY